MHVLGASTCREGPDRLARRRCRSETERPARPLELGVDEQVLALARPPSLAPLRPRLVLLVLHLRLVAPDRRDPRARRRRPAAHSLLLVLLARRRAWRRRGGAFLDERRRRRRVDDEQARKGEGEGGRGADARRVGERRRRGRAEVVLEDVGGSEEDGRRRGEGRRRRARDALRGAAPAGEGERGRRGGEARRGGRKGRRRDEDERGRRRGRRRGRGSGHHGGGMSTSDAWREENELPALEGEEGRVARGARAGPAARRLSLLTNERARLCRSC